MLTNCSIATISLALREVPRALARCVAPRHTDDQNGATRRGVCGAAVQVAARSGLGRTAGVEKNAAA